MVVESLGLGWFIALVFWGCSGLSGSRYGFLFRMFILGLRFAVVQGSGLFGVSGLFKAKGRGCLGFNLWRCLVSKVWGCLGPKVWACSGFGESNKPHDHPNL